MNLSKKYNINNLYMKYLFIDLLNIIIGIYGMYVAYKSNSNLTFFIMMLMGILLICYSIDHMIN